METTSFCGTPVGRIGITDDGRAVTRVFFSSQMEEGVESALARKTYDQLMEYFEGRRRAFTIPLDPKGTVFQRRVWKALGEIPYGETRSYKQIAEQIGHPKAYRAVGLANNRNPIADSHPVSPSDRKQWDTGWLCWRIVCKRTSFAARGRGQNAR